MRTCSFFGIDKLILIGYSGVDHIGNKKTLHRKTIKSALGTEEDIEITFLEDVQELMEFAKKKQLAIYCAEQHENSLSLHEWEVPTDDFILVFGNEIDGVSTELLGNCLKIIEVPRTGKHNSLNVGTSVGIYLWKISSAINNIATSPS